MPTMAQNAAKCEKSDVKYPVIHFTFCDCFHVFCDKCTASLIKIDIKKKKTYNFSQKHNFPQKVLKTFSQCF